MYKDIQNKNRSFQTLFCRHDFSKLSGIRYALQILVSNQLNDYLSELDIEWIQQHKSQLKALIQIFSDCILYQKCLSFRRIESFMEEVFRYLDTINTDIETSWQKELFARIREEIVFLHTYTRAYKNDTDLYVDFDRLLTIDYVAERALYCVLQYCIVQNDVARFKYYMKRYVNSHHFINGICFESILDYLQWLLLSSVEYKYICIYMKAIYQFYREHSALQEHWESLLSAWRHRKRHITQDMYQHILCYKYMIILALACDDIWADESLTREVEDYIALLRVSNGDQMAEVLGYVWFQVGRIYEVQWDRSKASQYFSKSIDIIGLVEYYFEHKKAYSSRYDSLVDFLEYEDVYLFQSICCTEEEYFDQLIRFDYT